MINKCMKTTLIELIQTDTSYNKSITRYLYKTHPELWNEVIQKTNFLPNTAKAKQRVWHIINDCYIRPTCPITNEFVSWCEKKYNTYINVAAKNQAMGAILREATKGDNHWRNRDPIKAINASEKYKQGLLDGRIMPMANRTQIDFVERSILTKQICLEKYGVANGSQTIAAREKIYQSHILRGAIPREMRTMRRLYYDAVWQITEQNWKTNFNNINPARLNRSTHALDHIYSIQQGFRDNIPPYIIGHYTNLCILTKSENSSKGKRCDKTIDELFMDINGKIAY